MDSGKYKFTRCSDGFTITGMGVVRVDGCSTSLEDSQADHTVSASVNTCTQEGKVVVEQFTTVSVSPNNHAVQTAPFKVTLSDQNMTNNLLACGPEK